MAQFDVQGALRAGYSESEIADHLAKQSNFDIAGARSAGYDDQSIISKLGNRPPPTDRSWGEAALDTGVGLVKGAVGLGRAVVSGADIAADLVAGRAAPGERFSDKIDFQTAEDMLQGAKSPGLKAREQQVEQTAETTGKEFGAAVRDQVGNETAARWSGVAAEAASKFKNTFTNPQLLTQAVAENASSLLPSAVGGRVTQMGAEALLQRATREGVEKAARTAGVAGAVTTGAIQQGHDTASETYRRMLALDEATWMEDENYRLLKRDMGAARAKDLIAGQASTTAGVKAGLASLAVNAGAAKLGGTAIESALLKGEGARIAEKGAAREVAKGFAGEAITEGLEEGAGQAAQNVGVQRLDASVDTLQGVGSAAGSGAAVGAAMGGGLSALSTLGQQRTQAEQRLGAAESVDEMIQAAGDLSGDLGEMAAVMGQAEQAVDAYLGTPPAQEETPGAAVAAPGQTAEAEGGDLSVTPAAAPVIGANPEAAVIPAGAVRQVQRVVDQDVAATTDFDRELAAAQAAVTREQTGLPTAEATPVLRDAVPQAEVRRALGAARAQEELAGGDPARIVASPSETAPGTFQLRRVPAPEAPPAVRGAVPAPELQQQRLEQAAVEGDFASARADLPAQLKQQGFRRAQQAVEQRNGVATAEEAQILDQASPGERLYDRVEGAPVAPPAAEPGPVDLARTQLRAQRAGIEVPQALRTRSEAATAPIAPTSVQPEESRARETTRYSQAKPVRLEARPAVVEKRDVAAEPPIVGRVASFVAVARRTNTPAARMFAQQYDEGRITDADVEQAMVERDEIANRVGDAAAQAPGQPSGVVPARELRARGVSPVLAEAMRRFGDLPRTPMQELVDRAREQRENPKGKPPTSQAPAETDPGADERLSRAAAEAAPAEDETTTRLERAAAAAPKREGLIVTDGIRRSATRTGETLQTKVDGKPVSVALADNKQLGTHGLLLRQIARVFGKRVQAFDDPEGTLGADGFVDGRDTDTIYLNVNSQMSPLAVFGHELAHQIERDMPGVYRTIKAAVAKSMDTGARAAARADRPGTNLDEVTSDVVGNAMADPEFWPGLFRELGVAKVPLDVVQRMASAVSDALTKVLRLVRQPGFKADKIVGDRLVEVREAVREGVRQYAEGRYEAAQAADREAQPDRYDRDEGGRFAKPEGAVKPAPAVPAAVSKRAAGARAARENMGMRFSKVRSATESTITDKKGDQYRVTVEPQAFGANATEPNSVLVEVRDSATGQRRGFVDFAIREDGALVAENAKVAPASKGRGLAEAMYRAARAAGYDVAPGRVQTDEGLAMVQSLQRKGVINKAAEGERFRAGDLELAPLEGETIPGERVLGLRRSAQRAAPEEKAEPTQDALMRELETAGVGAKEARDVARDIFDDPDEDAAAPTLLDEAGFISGDTGEIKRSAQRNNFGKLTAAQEKALESVGGITVQQTLRQRLQELRKDFGKRAVQGALDQFAPIKELNEEAYVLARMSKGYDGTLEAALMYGKPFLRDGVPDVDVNGKGFASVLADLQGEGDRFLWWVAAQRADRLKTLGLENLFSDQDISELKSLSDGDMPDGSKRSGAYAKALSEFNAFNDSVLAMAEESGLLDAKARQMYAGVPYVPFYRVLEDEGVSGPTFSSGLTNAKAWKKLKGGSQKLNNDLLANVLLNWSSLYQSSARNRAALATMKAAASAGVASQVASGTKKSVQVMNQGRTEHYLVDDPYLAEAISAMEYVVPKFLRPLSTVKRWLTMGVTANPAYKIRNLIRDSISAIGQADLSYNPITNFREGMAGTDKRSQTYASMVASGGAIRFGTALEGQDATRARQMVAKAAGLPTTLNAKNWEKMAGMVGDLWDAYQEVGDRFETVNRAALYKRLVAQGKTHAEAAFMARDLLDFSMQGRWPVIRFLASTVPFLNSRLQGLYKLARSGKADPKRMGYVLGAVTLASIGLMLAYDDDEDWKRRSDEDRDSAWWFKIGDTAVRIPKPFEIGAIGTLAERAVEMLASPDMTGKRFRESLSRAIFQTFAFDPTPQLAKPMLDVYANRDSFSGRQIESVADQRLRPQDRYDERTTMPARLLGQLGLPDPAQLAKGHYQALSPKQIDFLARGYFGWAGASTMAALDYGLRPFTDRGERPDIKLRDAFLAGSFVESLPSNSSRFVNQLYEEARAADQVYASLRAAQSSGDTVKVQELLAEEGATLRTRKMLDKATERLSDINKQIKQVESSRSLSGETKRKLIDKLSQQRSDLAEKVVTRSREARESSTR